MGFKAWMMKPDKFGLKIMNIFLIVIVIQQEKKKSQSYCGLSIIRRLSINLEDLIQLIGFQPVLSRLLQNHGLLQEHQRQPGLTVGLSLLYIGDEFWQF